MPYNKPTFTTVHLEISPLRSHAGRGKSLNDFKFGTFIGRFPSDDASSMAVKGLNQLAVRPLFHS